MEALGIESYFLVGEGFQGARIALDHAARFPEKVRSAGGARVAGWLTVALRRCARWCCPRLGIWRSELPVSDEI